MSQELLCSVLTEVLVVLWTTVSQELFCSLLTEVLFLLWTTKSQELFCSLLTEVLFLLWTTKSQELFCSVLTEVLVLLWTTLSQDLFCSVLTAQRHKSYSVLCWQKSLFCYEPHCHRIFSVLFWQHNVTRAILFCVDRTPCSVLWTTVSQELFCSVLKEILVLCYEPRCHNGFSVLCWQKSLFCVMNHSVTRVFRFCVDRSPCSVLWTKVSQGLFFSVLTEVLVLLWNTVSQELFCSVLTEVPVLCYEPQCHISLHFTISSKFLASNICFHRWKQMLTFRCLTSTIVDIPHR